MKLIFEKSTKGRKAMQLPELDVPSKVNLLPQIYLREELDLPEVSEVDIIRHYTALSKRNFGIRGSCLPWTSIPFHRITP